MAYGSTSRYFWIAAIVAGQCSAARAQSVIDYPLTGVPLKIGWDSFQNRKTPTSCIEGDEANDVGQTTEVDYKEVVDTSSLMNAFSVSAEAKVSSIGGFGGSASARFSREVQFSSTGTNIAVHVLTLRGATYVVPVGAAPAVTQAIARTQGSNSLGLVAGEDRQIGSIHLTDRALDWAKHDPWRFRLECGDSFVSAKIDGSGLEGLASGDTHSDSEKTSFSASLKASYGGAGGGVSTDNTTAKMESEDRVRITYRQLGGGGYKTATTIKDFKNLVENIGSAATGNNATTFILFEIRPYTELADYTLAVDEQPMATMANQFYRLYTIRDITTDVIVNPDQYITDEGASITSVASIGNAVQSDMLLIAAALKACTAIDKNKPRAPVSCQLPNRTDGTVVPTTDYDFRAGLPLKKSDAAAWASEQADQKTLADAEQALKSIPPTVSHFVCDIPDPLPLTGCVSGHYDQISNGRYTALSDKIQGLKSKLSSLPKAYDDDEMRYRVYVALPNQIRCSAHIEDNGCIVGTELLAYRDKIKASHP